MPTSSARTAHPYRDLDVIDSRAPRFNQAVIGSLALAAVLSGWWPILAVLALQLALGLRLGRRWCVACVAYFELVQPRIGQGPIEDARPPRFANQIGLVVLTAATLSHMVGLTALGSALGVLVAGLALFAAASGICVGCQLYRLGARLRGIRARSFNRMELSEMGMVNPGLGELVVAFSHSLCTECLDLVGELEASGRRYVSIDVRERPELARKYGIAIVPTAFSVDADGRVTARLVG